MNAFSRWRAERQQRDEAAVIKAIRMLRPSKASPIPISRLAYLSIGRTYPALYRLERADVVTSDWADDPHPRRRLYRLAPAAAPA